MESIINFIHHTFADTGKTTAVIGLSGGIDSATSFALTVKALGADRVHAYYLPTKTSHPIHLEHCQLLASCFKLPASHFHLLPIGSIIQKSWRIIKRGTKDEGQGTRDEIRLANISARVRMMVLYDQAKKLDALVVGTENYSEHLLGYYTRFGDEASDLEPIRHLYKTEVIDLAQTLGIPQPIITKPATADLWPGQTDAAELGFTYTQADPILRLIDQNQTLEAIVAEGHDQQLVAAIIKKVHSASFKHRVPYHL